MTTGRWLLAGLAVLLVAAQLRLWIGSGSVSEWLGLNSRIAQQELDNADQLARNQELDNEVQGLRHSDDALEERARRDLGLIRDGETYFQIIDQPQAKQ